MMYWGGVRVREGGQMQFGKRRDKTTSWQAAYFNGGLFEQI